MPDSSHMQQSLNGTNKSRSPFSRKASIKSFKKFLVINVNPPDTFTGYVSIAIKLDNNFLAHKQQRYTTLRKNDDRFSQLTPSTATGSHSEPMDLSATRHTNYQNKSTSQKRGQVSDNKKQRRRNNNLCMYCSNLVIRLLLILTRRIKLPTDPPPKLRQPKSNKTK